MSRKALCLLFCDYVLVGAEFFYVTPEYFYLREVRDVMSRIVALVGGSQSSIR